MEKGKGLDLIKEKKKGPNGCKKKKLKRPNMYGRSKYV